MILVSPPKKAINFSVVYAINALKWATIIATRKWTGLMRKTFQKCRGIHLRFAIIAFEMRKTKGI